MEDVYTYALQHNSDTIQTDEKKIYDTPYEDDGDYGPIFTEPPNKVEKIYEKFEGKRFCKLCNQNIRYVATLCTSLTYVNITV